MRASGPSPAAQENRGCLHVERAGENSRLHQKHHAAEKRQHRRERQHGQAQQHLRRETTACSRPCSRPRRGRSAARRTSPARRGGAAPRRSRAHAAEPDRSTRPRYGQRRVDARAIEATFVSRHSSTEHQAVPHPQQAPVLQHRGVVRLAEQAADDLREAGRCGPRSARRRRYASRSSASAAAVA